MAEKCKKNLKKPEKTPIDGFSLEPRFFTGTPSESKKSLK
jgi:hypothetical protein